MTEARRGPGYRYPPRVRSRARQLFSQYGWAKARIARHLDVPVDTLREWLRDLDEDTTANARRYDRATILAQHRDGATRAELKEEHGCSDRFLSDLINGKLPS